MKARVAAGVTAAWLLVGMVWGAQNAVGAAMRGSPIPLGPALRGTLVQSLPWIPVTLAIIYLTVRFPLGRRLTFKHLPIHAVAAIVVAFFANLLVVLGFWALRSEFNGVRVLIQQAAFWTAMRWHIALLIYAAISGLTHWFLHYRNARDHALHLARIEAQLARARVDALNAQIRPHFLFNTLHTIGQLWRSGQNETADALLDHLGNLLHKVNQLTARHEIPLSDELEFVREYLAIEQARFRDRLVVRVSADDDALACLVPPLMLQPLVENAVRHGVAGTSSNTEVTVTAAVRNDRLHLEVRDNGRGFDAASTRPGTGTGLRNTRERLDQLYKGDARFDVSSGTNGGAVVRIELPARSEFAYGDQPLA